MAKTGLKPIDELIVLAKGGNGLAFTALWDRHIDLLRSYIKNRFKNIDDYDVDDICSRSFEKAFRQIHNFDDSKSQFPTWLFTIARNCAIDHLRKEQKISDLSLDEHLNISDVTDTEKEFFKEEQKAELYKAMQRLNPDYYQVLYLMYFEDLDTSDIAKIMHKARRQVSDLIFRARKSLKTELERKGFIYERY